MKQRALSLLLALLLLLSLLPATALAEGDSAYIQLALTQEPFSDRFDLANCDYPARFSVGVQLKDITDLDHVIPASDCRVTFDWELAGSTVQTIRATTYDEENYYDFYISEAHPQHSGFDITCRVTVDYQGKTYTGSVFWGGLYRSSAYGDDGGGTSDPGGSSSTDRSKVVVAFDSQGGSPVDSVTYAAGQPYGTLPTPTRPGYRFVCWTTRGGVGVNVGTKVDPIGTQTLYAYWEESSGTGDPDGGSSYPNHEEAGDFDIVAQSYGAYLREYTGPGGHVAIPEGVTDTSTNVLFNRKDITGVTFPSTMKKIGIGFATYCDGITSVTIPEGVETIGNRVFSRCKNLETAVIPASVTRIDDGAFLGCPKLTIYGKAGSAAEAYAKKYDVPFSTGAPGQPQTPADAIPASGTSYASTQTVNVDGKAVEFQMYALKDEKGNPTNYIKLRDLAQILNGTKAQFAVGYDSAAKAISVTTGTAYTPNGSEMQTPFSGDRPYTGGMKSVTVNGEAVELLAITLTDDAGGGYTYFKLRDLGKALGFNTGWAREQGVFIESDKPYAE